MSDSNQLPTETYSKAFETFVQGSDDVVGLLAYAIYKGSIRERVTKGIVVPHHMRSPTATETDAYQGQAERALQRYATEVIESATPGIVAEAQAAAQGDIIKEIRNRTGIGSSVVTGVVVWLVTIILTMIVVYAAPGWVRNLVDRATPPAASSPATSPDKS